MIGSAVKILGETIPCSRIRKFLKTLSSGRNLFSPIVSESTGWNSSRLMRSNIHFQNSLCKNYLKFFPTIVNRHVLTNRNERQNPCCIRGLALMNKLCSKVSLRIKINLCKQGWNKPLWKIFQFENQAVTLPVAHVDKIPARNSIKILVG